MRIIFLATMATLVAGCSSVKKDQAQEVTLPTSLTEALNSSYRTPANKARDQYRHPQQTLSFFAIQPTMTVIEISPGAGWYLEILAPFLTKSGRYIAAMPPATGSAYMTQLNGKVNAWLESHPKLKVEKVEFSPPSPIAPDNTADMVLTFRNVHNWLAKDKAQAAFNAFYKVLKPGGVLGVTEHRADENSRPDALAKSGYVKESVVIKMAERAGFKLEAKSEINANPKDTKDHPEGVWTLPPTLRLKEKDSKKYIAIGESDRMTLRFIKPAQ